MRKIIVFIAALCFLLAGCTSEIPAEITENTADGAQISAEDSAESGNVSCEIVYNDLVLWKDTIDTTWGCGFVGVKNTGSTNLFMESGRFDIENSDGTLATTEDYIKELLGVPENYKLEAMLSLGIPDEFPEGHKIEDLPMKKVHWERF